MAAPLTLDQVKQHLRLDPTYTGEYELVGDYLLAGWALFLTESRRVEAPAVAPAPTVPPTPPNPLELNTAEMAIARQWLRLLLGHWYENRQSVAVAMNVLEVPDTCQKLMKLLREPVL